MDNEASRQNLAGKRNSATDGASDFLRATLRSGQKVQADGHLVILGDVHAGAEIVAGGHIVVLGTLMGVAHAGAFGDAQATVSALRLCPTQLRIASFIARSPDGVAMGGDLRGPELAEVVDGRVVIGRFFGEQSPVGGGFSWVKSL